MPHPQVEDVGLYSILLYDLNTQLVLHMQTHTHTYSSCPPCIFFKVFYFEIVIDSWEDAKIIHTISYTLHSASPNGDSYRAIVGGKKRTL